MKLDDANNVLTSFDIPPFVQEDIRGFIQKTADQCDIQDEFNEFLETISPSLRVNVQNELFENVLVKNLVIHKTVGHFWIHKMIDDKASK